MASLAPLLILLLTELICCSHEHTLNHVKRLSLSTKQQHANVREPLSFDERRRHRPAYFDVAATEARESEQRMPVPDKRLIGLFRCSGWGPSCSRVDDDSRRTSRLRQPSQRSYNAVYDIVGHEKASTVDDIKTAVRDGRPTVKFQPFFTLTSGRQFSDGIIYSPLNVLFSGVQITFI